MTDHKALVLSKTQFHVSNVNLKPENHGKKKKVNRMDIDGYVEVPAEVLNEISRTNIDDLQSYLFTKEGEPKDTGLGGLPYNVQFNDHPIELSLTADGKAAEFISKKIHKISAEPSHSGHVKLHLQIQVYPLTAKEMWALSQTSLEPHYLTIMPPPRQGDIEDKEAA
jgi:hypothetical protein